MSVAYQPATLPRRQSQPRVRHIQRPQRRQGIDWRPAKRIAVALLVVALALLVVYRYGEINRLNIQNRQMEASRQVVQQQHRQLELQLARLTSLDRLESIAVNQLGLRYPRPDEIYYLGEAGAAGVDGDGN